MKTVYTPLLSVRQAEEKDAEIALAETQRHLAASERALHAARAAREAWLNHYLAQALGGGDTRGLAELLTRIEGVEREAEDRVEAARQRVDEAREILIQRRRKREAVEKLHIEVVQAAARDAARRDQAELDEVGALRARAGKEIQDAE